MKPLTYRSLIATCSALLLAGCDSFHHSQWIVSNPSTSDILEIRSAVASTARQSGFDETTSRSKVPHTIVSYESEPAFVVTLGARRAEKTAIVDLLCFHPGIRPPERYTAAEASLDARLRAKFPGRIETRTTENALPIPHREGSPDSAESSR